MPHWSCLILLRISHYDSFLWSWRAFYVNEWIIITIMQMLLLLPFAKWPGLLVGRFVYISKLSIIIRLNVSEAKFFQEFFFREPISSLSSYWVARTMKVKPLRYLLKSQKFWVSTAKLRAIDPQVYYSILDSLGQRSQYISIKFLLHNQFENPKMCY